ncbi:hypothetical protein SAMN05216516_102493 [Izhakiella capsodis]|uniref:Uncharacterized protein n=1 Tax=Izhakiella capsodis TaxID=1367852 RepID=A0A1I4WHT5_9GAMM|nr:hypothetical protein [Izhakiella capsodis]SFN12830.1 hypothetical protein SAMN05216516_102493 [Izhakiella capsodis]
MTISRHAGIQARALFRIDHGNGYSGKLPGGLLKDNLLPVQKRLSIDLKRLQIDAHPLSTAHNISMDEFFAQAMEGDTIQLYNPRATSSLHGMNSRCN